MLFKVITTPIPASPQVKDTKFKTFYPSVNRNMEWCSLEPYIQQAEDFEIIPAIGQEFYDVLHAEYTSSGVIADTTKALTFRYLQTALANYTYYIASMQSNVRVGDAGTHETSSADISPIRQWVFNASRWETLKAGAKYLDMALAHMEKEVLAGNTDYDDFKNSSAYTESIELLIPNARIFQKFYNIKTSRRAYTSLRPYIKKAEDLLLQPVLCELYDEIKAENLAGTLTAANAALIPQIQSLLAEYTISQAVPDLNFVNDGEGWMISENTYDARPASDNLSKSVQQMLTRAEQNAAAFEMKLKNTIYAALDDYPTFRDGRCNDLTEDANGDGVPDVECEDYIEPGAVIL